MRAPICPVRASIRIRRPSAPLGSPTPRRWRPRTAARAGQSGQRSLPRSREAWMTCSSTARFLSGHRDRSRAAGPQPDVAASGRADHRTMPPRPTPLAASARVNAAITGWSLVHAFDRRNATFRLPRAGHAQAVDVRLAPFAGGLHGRLRGSEPGRTFKPILQERVAISAGAQRRAGVGLTAVCSRRGIEDGAVRQAP